MLSPDIENAMNTQIAAELYSAHLYLAMSAYCEEQALPGFAHWFRLQSDEEREHALKFLRHVVDRGGRVMLTGIDAPQSDFGSPQGAFEQALAHEMNVTMMIDGLFGMSVQHGDYASQVFLQWFVTEQVEEERAAAEIVQTLKTLGGEPASLLLLDRELGSRTAES
jgi:ferritin